MTELIQNDTPFIGSERSDSAYQGHSADILSRHGRSFNWAGRVLGAETGKAAAKLYHLCRILDDMADGDITSGPERLARTKRELDRGAALSDPLLAPFNRFISDYHIPRAALVDLLNGLMADQTEVALSDEAALIRYSYQVAGTVGLMMCPVLGCHDKNAFAFAVDMGIAMQLTNIARDVLEDAKMGRRYLPASWVGALTPEDITAAAHQPAGDTANRITSGVDQLLKRADIYYASGRKGLAYLPMRARLAISIAAMVYGEIGQKLRRKNLAWHDGRVVTSKAEKITASLAALSHLKGRRTGPDSLDITHDASLHIGFTLPKVEIKTAGKEGR